MSEMVRVKFLIPAQEYDAYMEDVAKRAVKAGTPEALLRCFIEEMVPHEVFLVVDEEA